MADLETIRHCCFQVLHNEISGKKKQRHDINQYAHLEIAVAEELSSICGEKSIANTNHTGKKLLSKDEEKFREVFWSLFIQGIIMLGIDKANQEFPWFTLTEYGRQCVLEERIVPHDPDGYLSILKNEIPQIDDTVLVYLSESLRAFTQGLYISSMVTLGCASEKAFLLLEEAYLEFLKAMSPSKAVAYEKSIKDRHIKRKFDEFRKRLSNLQVELGADRIPENTDIYFDGIFNIIRLMRNEASHPTGKEIARQEMYATLLMFPTYCRTVYSLIGLFDECRK